MTRYFFFYVSKLNSKEVILHTKSPKQFSSAINLQMTSSLRLLSAPSALTENGNMVEKQSHIITHFHM